MQSSRNLGKDGILAGVLLGIFCCGLSNFDRHGCDLCEANGMIAEYVK